MKGITNYVKGSFSVCGVIGEPIDHTLSPFIHNEINRYCNKESIYVPYHVQKEALQLVVDGAYALGIKGLNVTMPYKQSIMPYLEEVEVIATKIGAVNTLVRSENGYKGYNTDAHGLMKSMWRNGIDYKGKNVAIIGAGGAAYAAVACVLEDARSVHVFNRTKENGIKLKEHMVGEYQEDIYVYGLEEHSEERIDVVIQTTGVGMGEYIDQIPRGSEQLLEQASGAVDMIYNPEETAFIKCAKSNGVNVINGFDMLFYQAIRAYELMHGEELSLERVEQIRENVYRQMK